MLQSISVQLAERFDSYRTRLPSSLSSSIFAILDTFWSVPPFAIYRLSMTNNEVVNALRLISQRWDIDKEKLSFALSILCWLFDRKRWNSVQRHDWRHRSLIRRSILTNSLTACLNNFLRCSESIHQLNQHFRRAVFSKTLTDLRFRFSKISRTRDAARQKSRFCEEAAINNLDKFNMDFCLLPSWKDLETKD